MHLFNIVTAAAALASFAAAADNSTGSGNNVQLYINDGVNGRGSYAASIMSVCKDQTIYAIQCTSARRGGVHIGTSTCGTAAPVRNTHPLSSIILESHSLHLTPATYITDHQLHGQPLRMDR